jgi:hypothetical protein
MERARGTFVRSLRLPFSIDANRVQAAFKDGVLNITIPKPQEMRDKVQRIEVKRAEGAQQGASQRPGGSTQSSAETKYPRRRPNNSTPSKRDGSARAVPLRHSCEPAGGSAWPK